MGRQHPFVYGNTADELLVAASVSTGILLLFWIIRLVARRRMKVARRTENDIDDLAIELADRSKLFLLALPAIYVGLRFLLVPRELGRLVRMGAAVSSVAQVALWVTAVVDHWLMRYRRTRVSVDPSATATINIFRIGAVVAIWFVAALVAVENLGFSVTTVVASLGIGGVAVALATQNILGDLFASLSIIIDKPFVVGDTISIDNHVGTVEHIGIKTTRLRSDSGEELIVSNGDLLKSRIRNFQRMTRRRALIRLAVRADTPPEKLEQIPQRLRAIIDRQPHAAFDRAYFAAITDTGFEYELVYFVVSADFAVFAATQERVNLAVVRAFAEEDIGFTPKAPRPA